jgi:tetratricopeptide (TPR) repeat protein
MPNLVLRLALAGLLVTAVLPVANAADSPATKEGPDLSNVRSAIQVKNYNAALTELKGMVVNYPVPDVYSLMGFALRKTGDRAQSMTYYRKALDADPNHKGALEYQGELFVELGQIDKAKENLARLDKLCWFGCEEERDLKDAIAKAPKAK